MPHCHTLTDMAGERNPSFAAEQQVTTTTATTTMQAHIQATANLFPHSSSSTNMAVHQQSCLPSAITSTQPGCRSINLATNGCFLVVHMSQGTAIAP